ncbi:MAG TPA: hypothetical protein VN641_10195 [Urbifossiella sp.]|nr:hypothetical protein [Urbifossiella sp.]
MARLALVVLTFFALPAAVSADSFGDIDVTVESQPQGSATHGYGEFRFRVVNRSATSAHTVRLSLPQESYSSRGEHLRSVSRTVEVDPGKAVRVSLLYPENHDITGSGMAVAIDGRTFDRGVGLSLSSIARSYRFSSSGPLILYSRAVDPHFPDWIQRAQFGAESLGGNRFNLERSDSSCDAWSPNWLGHSRYDGVVVTGKDLRTMPAEARSALGRYVECGGSLLVLGGRGAPLPFGEIREVLPIAPLTNLWIGFGQLHVTASEDLSDKMLGEIQPIFDSWLDSAKPWQRAKSAAEANRVFPIVEDVETPVRGLLVLMFLFALVIGPINLVILNRRKQKLWLFWTVPVVSVFTCALVLGYMAITEGWAGRSRVEGFTVLDENSRRASTLGWMGFYSPLAARGGLHFSYDTEATLQNGEPPTSYGYRRRPTGGALTLDWTHEQHLASGWMTPRVPCHFAVRKSELRRERVTIARGSDGLPEAVNGLGAAMSTLWYMDDKGNVFKAEAIPAGGRATLQPDPNPSRAAAMNPRAIYASERWDSVVARVANNNLNVLRPRTFLAVLDGAPFLEEGLPGASVRRSASVVYGILKEGGDGG